MIFLGCQSKTGGPQQLRIVMDVPPATACTSLTSPLSPFSHLSELHSTRPSCKAMPPSHSDHWALLLLSWPFSYLHIPKPDLLCTRSSPHTTPTNSSSSPIFSFINLLDKSWVPPNCSLSAPQTHLGNLYLPQSGMFCPSESSTSFKALWHLPWRAQPSSGFQIAYCSHLAINIHFFQLQSYFSLCSSWLFMRTCVLESGCHVSHVFVTPTRISSGSLRTGCLGATHPFSITSLGELLSFAVTWCGTHTHTHTYTFSSAKMEINRYAPNLFFSYT